jgi:hypothetical protein
MWWTKVNTIREELGSMGEVFDAAFQRRFIDLEDTGSVVKGLDAAGELSSRSESDSAIFRFGSRQ